VSRSLASSLLLISLLLATAAGAGEIYGGTMYRAGKLHTLRGSELRGAIIVQPGGVLYDEADPNRANMPWLFVVSSNRSYGSFEFYTVYSGQSSVANFGLFAWACTPAYPCQSKWQEAPHTEPNFMFNYPLKDYPQYVGPRVDEGGHRVEALQFAQRSEQIGAENGVPRWRHSLLLWNRETVRWDRFWAHEMVAPARDCADIPEGCGGFGPILEVGKADPCAAPCDMPRLREIGYEDLQLSHDDGVSLLKGGIYGDTTWVAVHSQWPVIHRTANRSYTIGNLPNGTD